MLSYLFFVAAAALLTGFLVGYILASRQSGQLKQERAAANALLQQNQEEKQKQLLQIESNNTLIASLRQENTTLRLRLQHEQENHDRQQQQQDNLFKTQQLQFENLASRLLQEKSREFALSNNSQLQQLLQPLQKDLSSFRTKLEESYINGAKERYALGQELKNLVDMNRQLSEEANNLSNAFKNNHKLQGNWGEMILESMLEKSGLIKNVQFVTQQLLRDDNQQPLKDEQGHGLQPDVQILYPDRRKVVIDSKVSLVAYERYINAATEEASRTALQEHIRAIRNHVDELSRKNYPKYAVALDYTLMFVPVEPAFLDALKADSQLWEYAYRKNIIIVSPTNLLAVLKIIREMWKVDSQNKNAEKIAQRAGGIYDKFVGFLSNFTAIGHSLQTASEVYENALGQLSKGKNNLGSQIEKLKEMGANTQKSIPRDFTEE